MSDGRIRVRKGTHSHVPNDDSRKGRVRGDKDSDTGKTRYVRGVSQDGRLDYYYAYYDGAAAPACILNPKSLNLRQSMAFVEEVAE